MDDDFDAIFDQFFSLFSLRAFVSSAFFYVGMATVGAGFGKSLAISAIVYFLHIYHFGTRRFEQAGLLMLAIGLASWIDLLPVQDIIAHAKMQTVAALTN
jgi:hypothetical protein